MTDIVVSLLVVESHPLMREALCSAVADQPGWGKIYQAADALDAIHIAPDLRPDIILFSLGNPGWDDLVALEKLHELVPGASILALTSSETSASEQEILARGAKAAIIKSSSRGELLDALKLFQAKPALEGNANLVRLYKGKGEKLKIKRK